jgi:hypothetical protein
MADHNNLPEVTEEKVTPSDNPIDRMIDIALEAQDGKPETTTEETTGAEVVAPVDNKDSTSGNGDDKSQQQPNKEGTQTPQQTHGAKDLTLGDGTVVKGGAERRFYEQRETARQQASHYKEQADRAAQELQTARSELQTLRQATESLHGADPQTLRIGAAIVTDLQRDPVGTMKKLLAEVVAQGHSIESIGVGVDTLAIQRLLDERIPAQQDEPTEQEILQQAQQEVNNFYGAHPDARPHDAVLGRMLRDNPGVDLDTAYFELKNAFAEKGFDWSRSLEDNLNDASSQNITPQPKPQQQLPNGRPMTPNISNADEVKVAHEDTDMSDIVRAAMRESGMNV